MNAEDLRERLLSCAENGARWAIVRGDDIGDDRYVLPFNRVEDLQRSLGNNRGALEIYDFSISLEGQLANKRAWYPPVLCSVCQRLLDPSESDVNGSVAYVCGRHGAMPNPKP